MSYNKVILMGNLTRDPELKRLQGGASVLNFSIGVNKVWYDRNRQKQQQASFPSCVAWNGTADFIARYFAKGSPILIDGELRTREYTDTAGVKKYITEVLVTSAAFCGGKAGKDSPASPTNAAEPEAMPPFADLPPSLVDVPF